MTTLVAEPAPSRDPVRGPARSLRVAVLGGSSLALAGAAHLAGGGALPGPGMLVVTGFLLGLVALTATARRCRFPVLLLLLAVEQLLLHVAFTAAAGAGSICTGLMPAGHQHTGGVAGTGCGPLPHVAGAMAMPASMPSGWSMWAAHAGAVVATAWLLSRGESWLWRTADQIVRAATAAPSAELAPARLVAVTGTARPVACAAAYAPAAPRGPPELS